MMHPSSFKNTVLRHLDADSVRRLHLRRVDLPLRYDLEIPAEPIQNLFFLEEGIGSMTTSFENGAQVETSMFGYESVIGVSGLMGTKHSLNRIFMQLSGSGYSSPLRSAQEEFRRGGIFQDLALRYVQIQLTLSTQNAACNAMHSYEQRLARWLLICGDRAERVHLEMAQEFVAQMLGSTRSTVTIAAGHLKDKGLISYHRGSIQILNVEGLEAEACECYRVVRAHLETFANFDTGFAG
jgi:CRP-like cAMP-binding protein